MRRREFITLLGGAAAGWPLTARAQQRDAARHLGVLMGFVADDPEGQAGAVAFVRGLGTLNWKEGSNLRIDWRWGDSDPALLERYAAELVALGPDLVLAGSSSTAVGTLQRQTSTIPIVFANIPDPVGQGFVASLAHPGGNITGFSNYDPLMVSKWLGMLTQLTPPVAHVAALYNPATTCVYRIFDSAWTQRTDGVSSRPDEGPVQADSWRPGFALQVESNAGSRNPGP